MGILIIALVSVSLLLMVSSPDQATSGVFTKIAIGNWPSVLSSHPGISKPDLCATACVAPIAGARCRGFQVSANTCYLFQGVIEEKAISEILTEAQTAYRLVSMHVPQCNDHSGFQVVFTADDTFCLYPNSTRGDYYSAKTNCNSRGATVAFIDTPEKLAAARAILNQNPRTNIVVGVQYDNANDRFKGELDGQILYRENSLWRDGEPSWPGGCPCVMSTDKEQYNDIRCDVSGFHHVCEIVGLF